jgi:hypothetical protein
MKLVHDVGREQECVNQTIAWLHQVWEMTEHGKHLQPDPFYERNEVLTPEVVEQVINSIEDIFKSELRKYPDYHRTAQGISASQYLVPPRFDLLPYGEKVAIVQGIDRIFREYESDPLPMEPPTAESELKAG